jgi:dsRNA-specific ribonuclease
MEGLESTIQDFTSKHQVEGYSTFEYLDHQLEDKHDYRPFDLDKLHEHNLKIFGDVFESLIGAVFMDSRSIDETWRVLEHLIMPYIKVYANLDTLQDHPRTKLLELWNQKSYTKIFKCNH